MRFILIAVYSTEIQYSNSDRGGRVTGLRLFGMNGSKLVSDLLSDEKNVIGR